MYGQKNIKNTAEWLPSHPDHFNPKEINLVPHWICGSGGTEFSVGISQKRQTSFPARNRSKIYLCPACTPVIVLCQGYTNHRYTVVHMT